MMGTKLNPGAFDCYAKAADDEPMFVLLARDPLAPLVVQKWATLAKGKGADLAKVKEANACAEQMRKWRKEHSV
jgi:hypothetical protein